MHQKPMARFKKKQKKNNNFKGNVAVTISQHVSEYVDCALKAFGFL